MDLFAFFFCRHPAWLTPFDEDGDFFSQYVFVFFMVTIAVMKQHDQKQVVWKRVESIYRSITEFIINGSQDRNSSITACCRQQMMQRPSRGAAYLLVPHDVLCLFPNRTQDHQYGYDTYP